MTIISESANISKIKKYQMTISPDIMKMSDVPPGTKLDYKAYVHFSDPKQNGNNNDVLAVETNNGVYATNSATFTADFFRIVDIMGDDPFSFMVFRGTSKVGREFITCMLVD